MANLYTPFYEPAKDAMGDVLNWYALSLLRCNVIEEEDLIRIIKEKGYSAETLHGVLQEYADPYINMDLNRFATNCLSKIMLD